LAENKKKQKTNELHELIDQLSEQDDISVLEVVLDFIKALIELND
jgi:hypothetical protein